MKKNIKKIIFMLVFYFFVVLFITWPTVINLDSYMLPNYANISYSDAPEFIMLMEHCKEMSMSNNKFSCNVPGDKVRGWDLPYTYVYSRIIMANILTLDPIVFHNLFSLMSLFLCGISMYFASKYLLNDHYVSMILGFIYLSSNYVMNVFLNGTVSNLQIQWTPLIFIFTTKIILEKKYINSLFLGIFLALLVLSNSTYTSFMSIVLPIFILSHLLFVRLKLFDFSIITKFFFSVLVSFILSVNYLLKRLSYPGNIWGVQRITNIFWREINSFWHILLLNPKSIMHVGYITFVSTIFGIVMVVKNFKNKDYQKFFPYLVLLLASFILMLGPFSKFAPYFWFHELLPYLKYVRRITSFFHFILVSSCMLSGIFYLKIFKKYHKKKLLVFWFIIIIIYIVQISNSRFHNQLWAFLPV